MHPPWQELLWIAVYALLGVLLAVVLVNGVVVTVAVGAVCAAIFYASSHPARRTQRRATSERLNVGDYLVGFVVMAVPQGAAFGALMTLLDGDQDVGSGRQVARAAFFGLAMGATGVWELRRTSRGRRSAVV